MKKISINPSEMFESSVTADIADLRVKLNKELNIIVHNIISFTSKNFKCLNKHTIIRNYLYRNIRVHKLLLLNRNLLCYPSVTIIIIIIH